MIQRFISLSQPSKQEQENMRGRHVYIAKPNNGYIKQLLSLNLLKSKVRAKVKQLNTTRPPNVKSLEDVLDKLETSPLETCNKMVKTIHNNSWMVSEC